MKGAWAVGVGLFCLAACVLLGLYADWWFNHIEVALFGAF